MYITQFFNSFKEISNYTQPGIFSESEIDDLESHKTFEPKNRWD